ncbi:MAG: hypothetical protein KAS12_04540 [Candidatus Aenigmarchaeota archaeon]|nr:hypothetical protein [Candidatus Aenigmarchaeota archaeon]
MVIILNIVGVDYAFDEAIKTKSITIANMIEALGGNTENEAIEIPELDKYNFNHAACDVINEFINKPEEPDYETWIETVKDLPWTTIFPVQIYGNYLDISTLCKHASKYTLQKFALGKTIDEIHEVLSFTMETFPKNGNHELTITALNVINSFNVALPEMEYDVWIETIKDLYWADLQSIQVHSEFMATNTLNLYVTRYILRNYVFMKMSEDVPDEVILPESAFSSIIGCRLTTTALEMLRSFVGCNDEPTYESWVRVIDDLHWPDLHPIKVYSNYLPTKTLNEYITKYITEDFTGEKSIL